MIKGTYDWLEEDWDDKTNGYDMEEYSSKYNCKYTPIRDNNIEVLCEIEQGPSIITNSRSPITIKPIEKRFFGVKGFSFVSDQAKSTMTHTEIQNTVIEEIAGIFDFVRNPLD